MKVVAVSSVLNEADIIQQTVTHFLSQGVDSCIISNGGGTGIIHQLPKVTAVPQIGSFNQGAEITRLSYMAADKGADWIIPFDADEYWIDPLGTTVREVLEGLPPDVLKVHCAVFKHATWDQKYVTQNPMGKTCFRPSPEMTVWWGNHDVTLSTAGEEEHGLLEIRELQYRDYPHFLAKIQKARDLFASWAVPEEHGHHMRQLVEMTPEQLVAEWAKIQSGQTVHDPIPT